MLDLLHNYLYAPIQCLRCSIIMLKVETLVFISSKLKCSIYQYFSFIILSFFVISLSLSLNTYTHAYFPFDYPSTSVPSLIFIDHLIDHGSVRHVCLGTIIFYDFSYAALVHLWHPHFFMGFSVYC